MSWTLHKILHFSRGLQSVKVWPSTDPATRMASAEKEPSIMTDVTLKEKTRVEEVESVLRSRRRNAGML
jgi:hypothetical protein